MYDIAIYGSGFAGYSVAAPLLERGYSVVVVEKGPRNDFRKSVELAQVISPWQTVESAVHFGAVEFGVAANPPRFIGLGGTSSVWSGRWRPLDAVDFLRFKDGRSWPFDISELEPHYLAASVRFEFSLRNNLDFEPIRRRALNCGLRLVQTALQTEPIRLTERWGRLEDDYPRLVILSDAAQTEFNVSNGTIEDVFVRRNNGHRTKIEAHDHVIAAGGIASAGLVGELHHAATGCLQPFLDGYMDHPKGLAGTLWPTRGLEDLDELLKQNEFGLSLPEDELLQRGIGNHVVLLEPTDSRRDRAVARWSKHAIKLRLSAEQFPEKWNGIDYRRSSEVRWRISVDTRRDVNLFFRLISPRIEALFGRVDGKAWIDFVGASHPAGCTPMSSKPSGCQLHPNGRLNSLTNVYCISSSAFPCGGSANPTMTIAALGNRLSEQLTCNG